MPGEVRIGTSGWHYQHWLGVFYPQELRPRGAVTLPVIDRTLTGLVVDDDLGAIGQLVYSIHT